MVTSANFHYNAGSGGGKRKRLKERKQFKSDTGVTFGGGGEVMPDGITLFLIGVALGVYMGRKLREIGEQLWK